MTAGSDSSIPRERAASAERARLRARLIAARCAKPESERSAADAALGERLDALVASVGAALVGVYWPVRAEPDLADCYRRWSANGRALALPVVDGPGRALRFVAWSPGEPTVAGAHGIPRPRGDDPVVPELIVVPCVGFTASCHRLGYGGGYYDRTLAVHAAPAVGVAYDDAQIAEFEPGAHDVALDWVVTPSRVLAAPRAARAPTR